MDLSTYPEMSYLIVPSKGRLTDLLKCVLIFLGSIPIQGLAAFHEESATTNTGVHRHQDDRPDTTTTTPTDQQPADQQQQHHHQQQQEEEEEEEEE